MAVAVALAALAVGGAGGWLVHRRRTRRLIFDTAKRLGVDAVDGDDLDGALSRIETQSVSRLEDARRSDAELARFRLAIDGLPIGVVIADEIGKVHNATADRLLGSRPTDVFVADALRALVATALSGSAGRETVDLAGPPRRIVVVNGTPVHVPNGLRGALVTLEDVTERVRLEAVRTDFVANISHELRTPLGALAILAETLEGEHDVAVIDRLAGRLTTEAHRITRTIEDLLELSRIEHAALVDAEPVDAGSVVADAVDRVRLQADERQIEIVVDVDQPGQLVAGDRRQLVSAVANLLDNALKYSDRGSVVTVGVVSRSPIVAISVADSGIGIPSRDLGRVFERFYRVDRARSRETGGTGLGLSIVRHIAENHGGSVAVTSEEGFGSTFELRLPEGRVR